MRWPTLLVLFAFAATTTTQAIRPAHAAQAAQIATHDDPTYSDVIQRVVAMPNDYALQRRANKYGLNALSVLWEDTGRYEGSAVGPNISDVTLQVREPLGGDDFRTHLLPVIRFPNFTDKTGDIKADKLWVRVGNHKKGGELENVPLTRVLANLRDYLSDPQSLRGNDDFSAKRDSHFLVSAQHVFVPISQGGKAEFTPVVFNYQSAPGSPAVLTLLVTRQGMSATIIENKGGDQSYQTWGQQLFFNNEGQRTTFTAERRSDVQQRIESGTAKKQDAGALDEGADMLMLIQVPLIHESRGYLGGLAMTSDAPSNSAPVGMASPPAADRRSLESNVETAVLGHGEDAGPFHEMGNMKLERDARFPVRVTIQFYRATSNGVVDESDMAAVAKMINRVYKDADYVGSLVVPQDKRHRPTDWIKDNPHVGWNPWRNGTPVKIVKD